MIVDMNALLGIQFPMTKELPDQFFLLHIHAQDRMARRVVTPNQFLNLPELRIPIRMLPSCDGFIGLPWTKVMQL
jgi:hypothetical protein